MFKPMIAFAAALALAGCGLPSPSTISTAKMASKLTAKDLSFRPVTIKDLVASPYDDPKAIGNLITFEGSFDRDRWSYTYGKFTNGYRLWDHEGHSIRCYNIYSESNFSSFDGSHDLLPGAQWLLNYGTFVTIEGAYRPGYRSSSHGGDFYAEKGLDVYFINGKPVREFVSQPVRDHLTPD